MVIAARASACNHMPQAIILVQPHGQPALRWAHQVDLHDHMTTVVDQTSPWLTPRNTLANTIHDQLGAHMTSTSPKETIDQHEQQELAPIGLEPQRDGSHRRRLLGREVGGTRCVGCRLVVPPGGLRMPSRAGGTDAR